MATEVLLCSAVGGNDAWTLGAGASKVAAVSTPDDGDTTYIHTSAAASQDFTFADAVGILSSDVINSVSLTIRTKTATVGETACNAKQYEGLNLGTSFNIQGGGVYADVVEPARATAPGGGAWTLAKLNNLGVRMANVDDLDMRVTTIYATVDYTPVRGSKNLPLLGVG